jgi:hypothetical protein
MASPKIESFDHLVIDDRTGVFREGAIEFIDEVQAAMLYTTFTAVTVGGERFAVFFVEDPLPPSDRAAISAAKPDWLDVIVFAEVAPESNSERAVVDAETDTSAQARSTTCAFAAAVVVQDHGAFKFVPKSYLARLPGGSVEVTMDFDWNSRSWRGEAAVGSEPSGFEKRIP